jgi:hypothetical protein
MNAGCGCCRGVTVETPLDHRNRAGLDALSYRAGAYASFFESMKARLSAVHGLKTRDLDDPVIAWLDAWAIVGDILTFYQERIANEGYLRTAIERRSIVELAALVGYALRPGVASSTYLAYTLDPGSRTVIAAGSKAQSIPGPGELPQTFETSMDLDAAGEFSNLAPRMTRKQVFADEVPGIYIAGVSNNLNANDPVLLVSSPPRPVWIDTVEIQPQLNRTRIRLQSDKKQADGSSAGGNAQPAAASSQPAPDLSSSASTSSTPPPPPVSAETLIAPLTKPPAPHPATSFDLLRRRADVFDSGADTAPKLLQALHPEVRGRLYAALKNAAITPAPTSEVHAFRVRSAVFGHNAPLKAITDDKGLVVGTEEWPLGVGLSIFIQIPVPTATPTPIRAATFDAPVLMFRGAESTLNMFVRVSRGSQSGSTTESITASQPTKHVDVGPWKLDINYDATSSVLSFDFPQLGRSYKLHPDSELQLLTVTFDAGTLTVPVFQRVTLDQSGRHLIGSVTAQGIAISDESASAVDPLNVIHLDSVYDRIVKGSWAMIVRADTGNALVTTVTDNAQVSLTSYGISARVTRLTLKDPWLTPQDVSLSVARSTTVFAQTEQLPLADEPVTDEVSGDGIELGDLYAGLEPGRWVIVEGERTDIDGTSGIRAAELMMVAEVQQGVQSSSTNGTPGADGDKQSGRPGESLHSFLRLSNPLAYTYKRDSVVVYGNVVPATNGEVRSEVLGSGDSTKALQQFTLHTALVTPLTYVSAATVNGIASTLRVFVDDIEWHQIDSLASAGASDRCFTAQTDDDGKVTITFGDGLHGSRLPTGTANVRATYRVGIGTSGNLGAGRISQLTTKPLGVRTVINPLSASGAADRESRDAARDTVPTAAIALNRLVSVQDYADFASTFGGVGKATAVQLSDGHQDFVFVTVAGAGGAVIDPSSALVSNLSASLARFGDPHLPVAVAVCRFLFLVIDARVKVLPDYQWTSVAPRVKSALLDRFSYERYRIAQPVFLSSVTAAIQSVPGVDYAIVEAFDSITVDELADAESLHAKFAALAGATAPREVVVAHGSRRDPATGTLLPAEIAFLNPDASDTLLLAEITS